MSPTQSHTSPSILVYEDNQCFACLPHRLYLIAVQRDREAQRVFIIGNLLVQIHFIIDMTWWTGLAPREFEFPFPGSPVSTFLEGGANGLWNFPGARHVLGGRNLPLFHPIWSHHLSRMKGVFHGFISQNVSILQSQLHHKIVDLLLAITHWHFC